MGGELLLRSLLLLWLLLLGWWLVLLSTGGRRRGWVEGPLVDDGREAKECESGLFLGVVGLGGAVPVHRAVDASRCIEQ